MGAQGLIPAAIGGALKASLGTTDVQRTAPMLDVTARSTEAVFSYLAVAAILLVSSPAIGLVLLVSVPLATEGVILAAYTALRRPHAGTQSISRALSV
jgi:hypothetical protein